MVIVPFASSELSSQVAHHFNFKVISKPGRFLPCPWFSPPHPYLDKHICSLPIALLNIGNTDVVLPLTLSRERLPPSAQTPPLSGFREYASWPILKDPSPPYIISSRCTLPCSRLIPSRTGHSSTRAGRLFRRLPLNASGGNVDTESLQLLLVKRKKNENLFRLINLLTPLVVLWINGFSFGFFCRIRHPKKTVQPFYGLCPISRIFLLELSFSNTKLRYLNWCPFLGTLGTFPIQSTRYFSETRWLCDIMKMGPII